MMNLALRNLKVELRSFPAAVRSEMKRGRPVGKIAKADWTDFQNKAVQRG